MPLPPGAAHRDTTPLGKATTTATRASSLAAHGTITPPAGAAAAGAATANVAAAASATAASTAGTSRAAPARRTGGRVTGPSAR